MQKRFLLPLVVHSIFLVGCGATFVGFVSSPGSPGHVSGTIIQVQTELVEAPGPPMTVTAVTFANVGLITTVPFCGDQRSLFPLNVVVRADFTNGLYCYILTSVTIEH